ncbi:nitrate reductase molybdenum cofactor assembly chaperone [Actinomadura macrotermitis]|uniref:Nitrate reductase molybdenum cofactor assembly chaperone n=1 Tax=Actinomadura macrotermitis TaxID=2585200 RepID=A0A7K0BSD1_9ACTN|nr:hypothetical protein [Actinomadura macrotermitis]
MHVVVWRAAALLLRYPDQRFYDRRPMLRAAVRDLPDGPASRGLELFLDHVDRTPPLRLAVHYLEVCRGEGLRLARYADRACREGVLARLPDYYRMAGHEADGERPDLLPVMLEYAALCADDWLLLANRAALERLHLALLARGTPYAAPVGAVCATVGAAGQATFSDEDEPVLAGLAAEPESPEPEEAGAESALAAPPESLAPESLAVLLPFEAPAVEDDLPEPRLSVR